MPTLVWFGHDLSGATSARPANAEIGQLFFDTTIGALFVWNGSAWQKVGTTSTSGLFVAVGNVTTYNITTANAGQILLVSNLASTTLTLPASSAAAGMEVTVITSVVPTSNAGTKVSPANSTDLILGNGKTGGTTKSYTNTRATAVIGDLVTLASDGAGNWWIRASYGTWALA